MTYGSEETIEEFSSRSWNYRLKDCIWNKQQQRKYLTALMLNDNNDDNLTTFTAFSRDDGDDLWLIDGNNRIVTLLEFINGANGLYWTDDKHKVVLKFRGKLKRGYRLATKNEYNKFLNISVLWSIDNYTEKSFQSKKRTRDEPVLEFDSKFSYNSNSKCNYNSSNSPSTNSTCEESVLEIDSKHSFNSNSDFSICSSTNSTLFDGYITPLPTKCIKRLKTQR